MEHPRKTSEVKVLRDPIHGYIHIDLQVVWDCLNAREFQRLHRIHQLGGDFQVYHTAEHSRFAHSLGVYEIVRRMITEVTSIKETLSEDEKVEVCCAALLHDLGHGPFSHFFETISKVPHEVMTVKIILDPETEIHQALKKERDDLPAKVAAILTRTHPNPVLSEMITSQLDADRMDYLLRDAYETGTSYGTFDLERILRTLRVHNGHLCIKASGMHSVEDYIMARYHMYWQVYLHPDAKAYEILIQRFFEVYKKNRDQVRIDLVEPLFAGMDLDAFQDMDESRFFTAFQLARKSPVPELKDLARRILDRHLFEWIEEPAEAEKTAIQKKLKQCGLDESVYYFQDVHAANAYLPYSETDSPIWILESGGELSRLSAHSEIVKALEKMETHPHERIYFPREIL